MDKKKIYVGLDIGTDSVGYAVTDEAYKLYRFHGSDVWGSIIFDAGSLSDERRSFRSARRRLDRRKQRVNLIQEIFAEEIAKIDPSFFVRLTESYLWREDVEDEFVFFNDEGYTDIEYNKEYPTIHHLICDLMESNKSHDPRLIYLACAWLVAHRGHFLNKISVDRIEDITDIQSVYNRFLDFFKYNGYALPWYDIDVQRLGLVLKAKCGITEKTKRLTEVLFGVEKPSKVATEDFPYSLYFIIRLLAGAKCAPKDIFQKPDYAELDSISLGMEEEKFAELMSGIDEDYELIDALRGLYDWGLLADILDNEAGISTISAAKVATYEQHKKDLKMLKYFVRKYVPDKYNEVFRETKNDNYVAYSYHTDKKTAGGIKGKANVEDFSKYILKVIKNINPSEEDMESFENMKRRLDLRTFLPKQKNTDNRVIPHQLYEYELIKILEKGAEYLPFLIEKDSEGYVTRDKILSVFRYKLPYYVGPLNKSSEYSWVVRKTGKILPWNYSDMIDDDASEEAFISRMTNKCSYLPDKKVLPKDSLCYQRFMVLNEINNLKVDGHKIPVEAKQGIYTELFQKKKKVRRKDVEDYLICNNYYSKEDLETLSGIDIQIKSSLSSYHAFKRLLKQEILKESDVEHIIERASYAEDKSRVQKWLRKEYSDLSDDDIKYICQVKIKDFGRLSRDFLTTIEGADKKTGEINTILRLMWDTNDNLMELLSDKYTFVETIEGYKRDYYNGEGKTLAERLDEMYISNAVRRPIYRTLAIMKDVEKAIGKPDKIFVEVARGANPDQKGKRTKSRHEQILEYYANCKSDVRDLKKQLENMGEYVDNKLQSDRLFLYFMQFGKCAYSGRDIDLQKLMAGSKEYDIDHIYPQAYVKDDSIINNKVLVLSIINGEKTDIYPIKSEIRNQMRGVWSYWHEVGTISDEKYKRLTRSTPFTEDERYGFINRHLTETSQSTKAVAEILKERYPEAEIVYSKAMLTSDFRKKFGLVKSRIFNDLHHAEDAYLNVVVGNVYNMRFSKNWFKVNQEYSVKTETIFCHQVWCKGELVWDGVKMLKQVKKTVRKNTAHFVKYAIFKTGGLFDQQPVKKGKGLVPLKEGLPTEKYGGYNKAGAMFYIPTRYRAGKKSETIIMSVELLYGKKFLEDQKFAKQYAYVRLQKILGKPVDEVSFPMGMRPWKVNTMLSLDGFRVCIAGIGSGGKSLVAQSVMQFVADEFWKRYLKRVEKLVEKKKGNNNHIYDPEYDKVTFENNTKLYHLYMDKLQNSIYQKRINSPLKILEMGEETFLKLDIFQQCQTLLNIHSVFGRVSGGCDLTLIGGASKAAATVNFSSTISNWRKNYSDVRIIDQSPSGIWEVRSGNLLELL